jgi:hypothetical protein
MKQPSIVPWPLWLPRWLSDAAQEAALQTDLSPPAFLRWLIERHLLEPSSSAWKGDTVASNHERST